MFLQLKHLLITTMVNNNGTGNNNGSRYVESRN